MSLDNFISSFGRKIENSPKIFPAFNNYYQDIAVGGSKLGNLTKLDGEAMFPPGQTKSYPDFKWEWYINDVLKSVLPEPTLSDLTPECDGVVMMRLKITHLPTRTIYERQYWGYLGYNNIQDCEPVEGQPSQWGVFTDFYPDVDPLTFARLEYDYNKNGIVDASDLTIFLASNQ